MRHRQEIASNIAIQSHSEIADISRIGSEIRRLVRIGGCSTAHERRCRSLFGVGQSYSASDVGCIVIQFDGHTDGRSLCCVAIIVIERQGQRTR